MATEILRKKLGGMGGWGSLTFTIENGPSVTVPLAQGWATIPCEQIVKDKKNIPNTTIVYIPRLSKLSKLSFSIQLLTHMKSPCSIAEL